jgi:hypothetical protein
MLSAFSEKIELLLLVMLQIQFFFVENGSPNLLVSIRKQPALTKKEVV